MKKIALFTYFIFLLIISFSPFVFANEGYYYDEIGLLAPYQITSITDRLRDFEKENDSKLLIVCVNTTGDKTHAGFAFDYLFDSVGNTGNGIILLALYDDQVVIDTRGTACEALTKTRSNILFDMILADRFTNGDFYNGFLEFIDMCDAYYSMVSTKDYAGSSANFEPIEDDSDYSYSDDVPVDSTIVKLVLISLGIGLVAAIITVLILKRQLKSVRYAHNASGYVIQGSFSLTEKRDIYLYSTVSKIPKPQNNSSKSR